MQFVTRFRYVRSLLLDRSVGGLPGSRGTRSGRTAMRSWPRVRMEVLRRDSYCCSACGRPGDEITLQVSLAKANPECAPVLVTLCAICRRADDYSLLRSKTIADT